MSSSLRYIPDAGVLESEYAAQALRSVRDIKLSRTMMNSAKKKAKGKLKNAVPVLLNFALDVHGA
jgi:hypothetical protein